MRILVETLENGIATPERLREFLEVARFDGVRMCHDVAHTPFEGATFDRVDRIHLSDPARPGEADEHRLGPKTGATWATLVEALVRLDYAGDLVFEVDEMDPGRIDSVRSRIVDLIGEARNSMDEFRERHRLPRPASEEE